MTKPAISPSRAACTTAQYIGRITHMLNAYQGLADEIRRSERYTFRGTVALLFPRASKVGGQHGVNSYEVCFPVEAKRA